MPVAKNPQSGFSLIEMLVAVVILAVGLLGLAQLQITAMKANSQSASSMAAAGLAQRAIEKIMAWPPDDPNLDATGTGTLDSVTVAGAGTYTITWSVETPYEGVTNLCRVDVVVTSQQNVMHVLGNQQRVARAHTFRRSI